MTTALLILDNDAIKQVLDMRACMDALDRAYRALAAGNVSAGGRRQIYAPGGTPAASYCLKSMEAALPDSGYMVLRLTSDLVAEETSGSESRRVKLPRAPGNGFSGYVGLIVLFSTIDLAPVAILHDGYIQLVRVACTGALSVRLLARADAGDLALIGSGEQAWMHLAAIRGERKLRRVRVYSPNAERRNVFARKAAAEFKLNVQAMDNAQAAMDGADIVVAATNASTPILDGRWIAPGAHVISIVSGDKKTQRRELDDETMRRAALVVTHCKEDAIEMQNGDLAVPVERGIIRWDDVVDFPDLVTGRTAGRVRDTDITVFKNNGGTGMQFAAVAPLVYEAARAAGLGNKVPREWLVEQMIS
jgi:ornithine cyclodeaminase/alanine dehydrogenase-like protein (mu-crystallin family)